MTEYLKILYRVQGKIFTTVSFPNAVRLTELESHYLELCVRPVPLRGTETKTTSCALSLEQHEMGVTSWKAEKVLGFLMIWSWSWASKGTSQQRQITSCTRQSVASRIRKVILPLFSTLVGPTGLFGTALSHSEPERHWHIGANSAKGYEGDNHKSLLIPIWIFFFNVGYITAIIFTSINQFYDTLIALLSGSRFEEAKVSHQSRVFCQKMLVF